MIDYLNPSRISANPPEGTEKNCTTNCTKTAPQRENAESAIIFREDSPDNLSICDIWIDTSKDPFVWHIWDGEKWLGSFDFEEFHGAEPGTDYTDTTQDYTDEEADNG